MTTLANLRSGLRVLLNDTAAEGYLWNDAALRLHLNDAIRSYSRAFPRQREAALTTIAEQREYDLPDDCLAVVRVYLSGATLLEGEGAAPWDPACSYIVYANKLLLSPAPGGSGLSIALRYLATHASLVEDGDPSTVPDADEDLLLTHAAARALQTLLAEETKRRRFETQSGQPTRAVANLYWEQYERGIRLRTARVRPGRLVAV